jgi:predicted transcriptional regulator
MQSFRAWLEHRPDEAPAAEKLALVIAQSGTAGISREGLEKVLGISGDVLENLLRALVASGQVVVVRVGGRRGYSAAVS